MVSKREEFAGILERTPGFLTVRAPRWIILGQEELEFSVTAGGPETAEDPVITCQGRQVAFTRENERVRVRELPEKTGEYRYEIRWGKSRTFAEFRVLPDRKSCFTAAAVSWQKSSSAGRKKVICTGHF